MKKFFLFISMFCTLQTVFCQKESPLTGNELFIKTIEKMNNVCLVIYKANDGNSEKIKALVKQVSEIDIKMSDEEYTNTFIKIANLPNDFDLATELKIIHENIVLLKNKYGEAFNHTNIENAAVEVQKALFVGIGYPCAHPWSNALCQAAVTATAVSAGIACTAATAGLGLIQCMIGVSIVETAGLDACYSTYCPEKN